MQSCPRCNLPQDKKNNEICQYCGYAFDIDKPKPKQVRNKKKSTLLRLILGWLFGCIFFIIGFNLFKDIPIVGLLFIFMGCLALPPIINKIESIFNFHLKFYVKVFIYIFCFLVIWNVPGKYYNPETTKSEELKTDKDKTEKPVSREELNESCYDLGYRYGLCATKAMHEIPCKLENDIIIPARCRGKAETKRGVKAGAKAVYDALNLNTGGSSSSSSLNMLTAPIDVLRKKLNGKTKSEVKRLVGSPDRIEVFAGKKCWVYGNTYTSKDRGIVFDGVRVLTVTFY